MPYVNVKITKGAVTKDQKQALVRDITTSLVTHLGKKPEHIHIVIDEIDPENWGFSGVLTTEYIQNKQEKTADVPLTTEYVLPRLLKSSPKKKDTLHHFISAMYQFQPKVTTADIDKLISQLQKEKLIKIDASGKVTYTR
jgi:4-oxalocrotonate tautomerase